jgi:5-oxoprolinase (ATP-hydrolysing)/N-methylhydantoinase A
MTANRNIRRAGIDIGGTFTDFVLFDGSGDIRLHKCLTTPHEPSEAALTGLVELAAGAGIGVEDIDEIVHGTTLVTNAIIERNGAAVGMLTTRGFRDVLELGSEQRYDIYDLFLQFPEPLVDRARRLEVFERTGADGRMIAPLDEETVRATARRLVEDGVEAIAICFLHSYRNPEHERRARDIVLALFPALSVSISSDVVAEISEYQRFVTTCANAYVKPLIARYLARLESELERLGFRGDFRLMQSAGGLVSVDVARAFPVRLLESGPAGGALASTWFGKAAGKGSVVAFDMGGTTAKTCLIENGRPHLASMLEAGRIHRFKSGSGLPVKVPAVDMIEIGAGGGSVASVNGVGLLQVGPHSAGADPGPACYGLGGEQPTVTDASLLLGYYDPGFFLGGRMALDAGAAAKAVGGMAEPLGLSEVQAAWGIHQIVIQNMASAARIHLIERGHDPRSFAMIALGGAGPTFAAGVARALGMEEVIVPPATGAASAFGFLTAPLSFDLVRSWPVVLSPGFDADRLNRVLDELKEEGYSLLTQAGVTAETVEVERSADMRMVGQLHEINVPLPDGPIGAHSLHAIRTAFHTVYQARYTAVPQLAAIEALSFRVHVRGPLPDMPVPVGDLSLSGPVLKGTRPAYFGGGFIDTAVYDRYALRPGTTIAGPAIIEEREATTVLQPGDRLTVDDAGNLCIAVAPIARPAVTRKANAVTTEIARLEADPISLEVVWSRLVNVAEEMWSTVCRTAFSLIIAESQDFGCAILDRHGETLAHSSRIMPVFNLTLPLVVKALIKRYPIETLSPGDVLITNDPWLCAGHLYDVAIVTPVFHNGRVVALMGTVGHVGDIGGSRDGLNVGEIYEEGLQIPPMKLVKSGTENEDLFRLIYENVRDPMQVIGDIRSLVAANATGARRLLGLMADYGLDDLSALATIVQSRSEKAMREAIRTLPDGVYRSEIWNNPLGKPMRFPLTVMVADDTIELDFDGTPAQVGRGGINSTLSYTTAHATYPLKCMLTPAVRGNAGCYRPFTVKAPAGSILNCTHPAAVSIRTRTGWYLAPNIFRALAAPAPSQTQAFSALPSILSVYGRSADGALYYDHLLLGGGQGASHGHDGKSSLLWPTSAATASLELLESRSPIVVLEKSLVQDSGGTGLHRGGLGVRVRLAKSDADGLPMTVVVSPEGVDAPVDGLFGGASGATASAALLAADGSLIRDCGTGEVLTLDGPGNVVELCLSGGSGFGEPSERDIEAIETDLRQGYVSHEAANRIYGYSGRKLGTDALASV